MRFFLPFSLLLPSLPIILSFFFFNDPATTEIYTLSLHDALPIWTSATTAGWSGSWPASMAAGCRPAGSPSSSPDRKSTRLNSSHSQISYAVFCLKKKKKKKKHSPSKSQTTTHTTQPSNTLETHHY